MKSVKIIEENKIQIANTNQFVELTPCGVVCARLNWGKTFPSEKAWIDAGGDAEEHNVLYSALTALYNHLVAIVQADERLAVDAKTADRVLSDEQKTNATRAINNVAGLIGKRYNASGKSYRNCITVESAHISNWFVVLSNGRNNLCACETFARKAVVYLFAIMQGKYAESPAAVIAAEKEPAIKSEKKEAKKEVQIIVSEKEVNELKEECAIKDAKIKELQKLLEDARNVLAGNKKNAELVAAIENALK